MIAARPSPLCQSPKRVWNKRRSCLSRKDYSVRGCRDRNRLELAAAANETDGAVLLIGGWDESEVEPLTELVRALAEDLEVSDAVGMLITRVVGDRLAVSAETLLSNRVDVGSQTSTSSSGATLPPATRCVLLRGEAAKALMPYLRSEMYEAGFSPAVFGAFTPAHDELPLVEVATTIVLAHEAYWDLQAEPKEDDIVPTSWPGEKEWTPSDTTIALRVSTDKAVVFDPPAGDDVSDAVTSPEASRMREDVSNVLALDGVVGGALRKALLDTITQPDWPHETADRPPTPLWERDTDDGIGVDSREPSSSGAPQLRVPPKSWGLSDEALEEVRRSTPLRTFLARISSLYPEYHVRMMPADALEPDGVPGAMSSTLDGDGSQSRVGTVVANAAVYGDEFKWHLDWDPSVSEATSPFAERFGRYVNRSKGRPLFVSALVYLNGPNPWTPDMDAETMFLDPDTGTGFFVRPAPGRVILMEQDVLHRVSPPSKSAGVPRYSLVLKLCFYPKTATTAPTVARDGWGEPTRFGSASGLSAPPQLLQNDSQRLEYDKTDVIKRVTLVRHGQSTWNEEGRLQGSSDFSVLTPKGEAQAEITREMLQDKRFDVCFRSPLARASRTAEVIWGSRSEEMVDVSDLREIDLYSFQGLLKEEGKKKHGESYAAWKTDPVNFEIDGHFPVRELWKRGADCWDTILEADGSDVLVVAHNAINQSMVANALGLGPEYFRRLVQSNCGLTTLVFRQSSTDENAAFVVLEQLNQTRAAPLAGNADMTKSRAVLICSSGSQGAELDDIAAGVSKALKDERVESVRFDDCTSSRVLAQNVADRLNLSEGPRASVAVMAELATPGSTVLFASAQTIDDVLSLALNIDEESGLNVSFSLGGVTIIDFDDLGGGACVACVNVTSHLTS